MAALEKAKLQEVSADEQENTIGEAVPVQFNPSSLKLKLTNQMEGGRSSGRVRRQRSGAGKTVLSMELVFDTADEGTAEEPVSVRSKTAIVERYVVPNGENSETPPRLRFEWNDLVVSGLVETVDIDFDLFAANGTPLRAKVNLSIKEQEPKYQLKSSDNATAPGESNANSNANGSDQSAAALDGESPADFAARNGLDPNAWRGLDVDLSAGLSLSAGVEVGFSAGLSVGAGIGLSAGASAGIDLSLEAALGLSVEANFAASAKASVGGITTSSAGLALSAAGGVASAVETVKVAKANAAVNQTKQNFAQPTTTSGGGSTLVSSSDNNHPKVSAQSITASSRQTHAPLSKTGPRSITEQQNAAPAPQPPLADARATSFAAGVPLRPQLGSIATQVQPRLGVSQTASVLDGPPTTRDPATPAWQALPLRGSVKRYPTSRGNSPSDSGCNCKEKNS